MEFIFSTSPLSLPSLPPSLTGLGTRLDCTAGDWGQLVQFV